MSDKDLKYITKHISSKVAIMLKEYLNGTRC